MKKLYFSILSVAAFTGMNAQSITASNIPVPGDNYYYYNVAASSYSMNGSAGTGQNYNFSAITADTVMAVKSYVTPASTPNGGSFGSSTVAEKDTMGGTIYSYYKGTSTSYQLEGIDMVVAGNTVTVTMSDPGILFNSFPFNYNSTNGTDQIAGSFSAGFTTGTLTGDVTTLVDGSGSINILGTNYPNVIRLKITTNMTASVFGSPVLTQTETRFQYYSSANKFPLLEYAIRDVGGQVDTIVVVNSISVVGMNENSSISFNLFPNPTKNEINILFNQAMDNNASVEVINAVGQVVKAENINNNISKKVDLSDLNSGMYYIRVRNGNATRVEKVIVE